jgi:Uma2 family endonuclease
MPRTAEPLVGVLLPHPNRVRWTRTQYEAMREIGVLTGRHELIDGEILSKSGQKPLHSVALTLVLQYLVSLFGALHLRIQTTIDVAGADRAYNEPEPDAAVTVHPAGAYSDHHPGPDDLLLVIEVSDTTLRFDRTTKAALYARAGVREYWVLDLGGRALFVHRQPQGAEYAEIIRYGADEEVAPLARPESPVVVAALLPPAE